jgi:phosphate transport system substrate-binding protein
MSRTLAATLAVLLAGCSSGPDKTPQTDGGERKDQLTVEPDLAPPIKLDLTIDTYPLVDGSTSTHPLGMLVACELLGMPYTWKEWWDQTKRIFPDPADPADEVAKKITNHVTHNGTHGAYVNLIEGKADLILVAREPSQDELDEAKKKQVTLETKAVALDAFVFILNHQNPIKSLTTKQIQEIYTGKITQWDEVGGPAKQINPYQRNENSGSQELMKKLVMKELTMVDAPDMILQGMMGPINKIGEDVLGLGYSVFFFEQFMAPNEKLKLCGVDGVVPDSKTIHSRAYPFATEVYAAIRSDLDPKSNAYKLRDWLLTAAGQSTIKKSGYVTVSGI